eukprot:3657506-Pyramimonas_sp.AAC.1
MAEHCCRWYAVDTVVFDVHRAVRGSGGRAPLLPPFQCIRRGLARRVACRPARYDCIISAAAFSNTRMVPCPRRLFMGTALAVGAVFVEAAGLLTLVSPPASAVAEGLADALWPKNELQHMLLVKHITSHFVTRTRTRLITWVIISPALR